MMLHRRLCVLGGKNARAEEKVLRSMHVHSPKKQQPTARTRNAHTDEERLRRVAQHHRKNPGVGEVARGGDGAKAEEQENADRPHGEAYFWFVFV